jgi:hypothetical protein
MRRQFMYGRTTPLVRSLVCALGMLALTGAREPLRAQDALARRLVADLMLLHQLLKARDAVPVAPQLALREREALALTAEQIDVIDSIHGALRRYITLNRAGLLDVAGDASIALWTGSAVDRVLLRLELHQLADRNLDLYLEMRRERAALLRLLTNQQRVRYREIEAGLYAVASASVNVRDSDLLQTLGSGRGVPHPAKQALAHVDTLGLSAEQAAGIRRLGNEIDTAIVRHFAAEIGRAHDVIAIWAIDAEPDTTALRAEEHAAAEDEFILADVLLSTRDRAFALLDPGQQSPLKQLQRNAVEEALRPSPRTRPCTAGTPTGGFIRGGLRVHFSVTFGADSAELHVVFVGRRDPARDNVPAIARPVLPPATSGGSMGAWSVQYDRDSRTAWVHRHQVELGEQNLVLIEGMDDPRVPPRVMATVRMPRRIFTGGCSGQSFADLLYVQLRRVPEVQALLTR